MSYLIFNEGIFMKNKNSFFLGGASKNKKSGQVVENKINVKPIKTSIKNHVENQLPESGKHNPSPLTPLKRKVL